MMANTFTADDVLKFLDRCLKDNRLWSFVNLEHPYVYTANSRLTLYADETRWAIVSDVSGYNPRADLFLSTVTWLGNALERLPRGGDKQQYSVNVEFLPLIEGAELNAAVSHFNTSISPVRIKVRDQTVLVPAGPGDFVPNNDSRSWPKDARAEDLGRYIAYQYAEICRATDAEKRVHLPSALPELMQMDQWHHRQWYYYPPGHPPEIGDAPSSYETFRLIADVLATRDPSRYRPTLAPNSHWSNWPEAGAL